jgi:O-antigen ligase
MPRLWGFFPEGTLSGVSGYTAGLTSHYSYNGIFCSLAFVTRSSKMIFSKNNKKTSKNDYIFMFASFLALVLTNKRAHLIFSVLSIATAYMILNSEVFAKKLFRNILYLVITAILTYALTTIIPEAKTVFFRFFNQIDISTGRFSAWNVAWQVFTKNPIYGVGWFNFRLYYPIISEVHNVYLQILCEFGVIGFMFIVPTMFWTLSLTARAVHTVKISEHRTMLAVSFSYQLFFLLYCFTGLCLTDVTQMGYFLMCAIGYSFYSQCKNSTIITTKNMKSYIAPYFRFKYR